MSDDGGTPAALQFDRAEIAGGAPGALTCTMCQAPIQASYFEVGGAVACVGCGREAGEQAVTGSPAGRFFRALAFGTLAGAVGCGIYYAVRAVTGYEVGLISILVGFMVGGAVRAGSHRRGGWLYQGLAMLLTYLAIVCTYLPETLVAYREAMAKETDAGTGLAVVMFVILLAVMMVAPFLAGIQNVIGILIIGFGLYEAWKMNRRQAVVVTGPYRVGPAPAAPPVPEAG